MKEQSLPKQNNGSSLILVILAQHNIEKGNLRDTINIQRRSIQKVQVILESNCGILSCLILAL